MKENKLVRAARTLRYRLGGGTHYRSKIYHPVLRQALQRARTRSDISDHLSTIFFFAVDARPKLIVELGTRGGESTRVLLAAAHLCGARVLSIDIDDVGHIDAPFRELWHFVRDDDVAFGRSKFSDWCAGHGLPAVADLLFIDTSHLYEHTRQELAVWAPYLAPSGTMILHDTNMGTGRYGRLDGSIGVGWDNQRGVIKALEEFVGRAYDERVFFDDLAGGYLIKHFPYCSGLTVLKKTQHAEHAADAGCAEQIGGSSRDDDARPRLASPPGLP